MIPPQRSSLFQLGLALGELLQSRTLDPTHFAAMDNFLAIHGKLVKIDPQLQPWVDAQWLLFRVQRPLPPEGWSQYFLSRVIATLDAPSTGEADASSMHQPHDLRGDPLDE